MENASKALIIAGSVLIAILVIGLLVFSFDRIKEYASAQNEAETAETITEFNKQYDAYYRNNLVGSELLSLVNKVVDYNYEYYKLKDNTIINDYQELKMEIKFTKKITVIDNANNIEAKTYTAQELKDIADKLDSIKKQYEIEDSSSSVYDSVINKSYAYLSSYRTDALKNLIKEKYKYSEQWRIDNKYTEIMTHVNRYLSYKNALSQLKSRTFRAVKYEYNGGNERVTKMIFEQNN